MLASRGRAATSHLYSSGVPTTFGHAARHPEGSLTHPVQSGSERLEHHVTSVATCFVVASGTRLDRWPDGGLSEGYGHDGPAVGLGDGQTEAEGVPSEGGRGDALLRRMSPHLT